MKMKAFEDANAVTDESIDAVVAMMRLKLENRYRWSQATIDEFLSRGIEVKTKDIMWNREETSQKKKVTLDDVLDLAIESSDDHFENAVLMMQHRPQELVDALDPVIAIGGSYNGPHRVRLIENYSIYGTMTLYLELLPKEKK